MTATSGRAIATRRLAIVRARASRRLARRSSASASSAVGSPDGGPGGAEEAVEAGGGRFGGLLRGSFEDVGRWGAGADLGGGFGELAGDDPARALGEAGERAGRGVAGAQPDGEHLADGVGLGAHPQAPLVGQVVELEPASATRRRRRTPPRGPAPQPWTGAGRARGRHRRRGRRRCRRVACGGSPPRVEVAEAGAAQPQLEILAAASVHGSGRPRSAADASIGPHTDDSFDGGGRNGGAESAAGPLGVRREANGEPFRCAHQRCAPATPRRRRRPWRSRGLGRSSGCLGAGEDARFGGDPADRVDQLPAGQRHAAIRRR